MTTYTGEELRFAREALGLTQDAVALMAGSSQYAVSIFENGIQKPSTEILCRLAHVLKLPVDEETLAERGRRFRELREKKGWTVDYLRTLTGHNPYDLEHGVRNVSPDIAIRVDEALRGPRKTRTDAGEARTRETRERAAPTICWRVKAWTFTPGTRYRLIPAEGRGHSREQWREDTPIMLYLRKEGAHHVFRSAHGGYLKTWTDQQLIDTKVEEVKKK